MQPRELLVAGVAVVFGLVVIGAAFRDSPFAFQLWLPRLLERKFGRAKARFLLGILGISLFLLGSYLASRDLWKG